VLVTGVDVVSLAASAKKAGYRVYATDYFGDEDLKRLCHESRSIVKQMPGRDSGRLSIDFDPEALLRLTRELLKNNEIDAALLSSGLDDSVDVLFELNDMIPILGNHPSVIEKVRDKMTFFQELKRLGIPHPEAAIVENFEEAKEKSQDIGYPVLVKPLRGFGGAGIRKARDPRELGQAFRNASLVDEKVLIQEYVSGIPASTSLISSTKGAITLTLNEQLLGLNEVGQEEPFGYCGNVVPLMATRAVADRCKRVAERIASHFGLVGSNGIDLVISKEGTPYVIEVNPRFQGTLECVERILGINMVETHMKACIGGSLPTILKNPSVFCVRLILFAPRRSIVPDLNTFEEVRDIPLPGVIIEKGEPVCSIIIEEKTRSSALKKARAIVKLVYGKPTTNPLNRQKDSLFSMS